MTEPREARNRPPGPPRYAVGALVSLVLLDAARLYPLWLPLFQGVVTEEWPEVLWAVDLSLGVFLVGNLVLVAWRPEPLRVAVELANSVAGGISLLTHVLVWPFAFLLLWPGLDVVMRGAMALALVATAIAAVVNIGRLIGTALSADATA